jgi:hypothetical protein
MIVKNDPNAKRRTWAEIEALKTSWRADPCFDLWDVDERFAAHREALYLYQLETELHWARQRNEELLLAVKAFTVAYDGLRGLING